MKSNIPIYRIKEPEGLMTKEEIRNYNYINEERKKKSNNPYFIKPKKRIKEKLQQIAGKKYKNNCNKNQKIIKYNNHNPNIKKAKKEIIQLEKGNNDTLIKNFDIQDEIKSIDIRINYEKLTYAESQKELENLKNEIDKLEAEAREYIQKINKKIFFNLTLSPNFKQILLVNNKVEIYPKQFKNVYHTFYLKTDISNMNNLEGNLFDCIKEYYTKFCNSSSPNNNSNYLIIYLNEKNYDSEIYFQNIFSKLNVKKFGKSYIYKNLCSNQFVQNEKIYGIIYDINKNYQSKNYSFRLINLSLSIPYLKILLDSLKSKFNENISNNYKIEREDKNFKNNKEQNEMLAIIKNLLFYKPKKALIIYNIEEKTLFDNNFKINIGI